MADLGNSLVNTPVYGVGYRFLDSYEEENLRIRVVYLEDIYSERSEAYLGEDFGWFPGGSDDYDYDLMLKGHYYRVLVEKVSTGETYSTLLSWTEHARYFFGGQIMAEHLYRGAFEGTSSMWGRYSMAPVPSICSSAYFKEPVECSRQALVKDSIKSGCGVMKRFLWSCAEERSPKLYFLKDRGYLHGLRLDKNYDHTGRVLNFFGDGPKGYKSVPFSHASLMSKTLKRMTAQGSCEIRSFRELSSGDLEVCVRYRRLEVYPILSNILDQVASCASATGLVSFTRCEGSFKNSVVSFLGFIERPNHEMLPEHPSADEKVEVIFLKNSFLWWFDGDTDEG